MWREVLRILNEATVEGLMQSHTPTHSDSFLASLRHSNEVFAAFKVHAMSQSMAAKLLNTDGSLKPFRQWADEVKGISSHYVGAWLQTEYDTAIIRAHNAADWQQFIQDADIMPNLRWMPTTSPTPESSHRSFWEKKLTLPVSDPFWDEHHPGDRWNCKCSLEQTDDPPTHELKKEFAGEAPQPGLTNNPGKDGHTFSHDHPYFPKSCSSCSFYNKATLKNRLLPKFLNARAKNCYDCPYIDGCIHAAEEKMKIDKDRTKQLKTEAAFLRDRIFRNEQFNHDVTISQKKIKEWLNQPHKFYREKNELLLDLPKVFNKAKYKGETIDPKVRPGVAKSHIFEIELCGEPSYIIVHEMEWEEFQIHSISDHISI